MRLLSLTTRWSWCRGLAFAAAIAHANPPGENRPLEYTVAQYSMADGLPDVVAQVVRQTPDGFLWIATMNGLARFDGVQFEVFHPVQTPGLPSDRIRCLSVDAKGGLWIGTDLGLAVYRDGRFERPVPIETVVTAVVVDGTSRVWIGTRERGLWRFEHGELVDCSAGLRGRADLHITTLFEDHAGTVWVGLESGGLAHVKNNRVERVPGVPANPPRSGTRGTTSFAEDAENGLWFGNEASLYRWKDGTLQRFGPEQGLDHEPITGVFVDPQDRIWVAARRVSRLASPTAKKLEPVQIPNVDFCRTITMDAENGYWLGTSGSGIIRLSRSAFSAEQNPGGLPGIANALAYDPLTRGTYIVAGDGVFAVNSDGPVQRLEAANGESSAWSIAATRGRGLVGRRGPLEIWSDGIRTVHPELRGAHIIRPDSSGAVWLGTDVGVFRWWSGVANRMNSALGIGESTTATAIDERAGVVYLATLDGTLVRYANGAAERYRIPVATEVRALRVDNGGNVWVGTLGSGMLLFRDGQFWNPPALIDPFHGFVSAIELSDSGTMVVGTYVGLFWARRNDVVAAALGQTQAPPFVHVGAVEGIRPSPVGFGVRPCSGNTPQGKLWFATHAGLVVVDPARIENRPQYAPIVQILQVSDDGQPLPRGPAGVNVPAGTGGIRIDFTAPAFARPDALKFRYRLQDHDHAWVDAGTLRIAYYGHLLPGAHRFEVIAKPEGGNWTAPASIVLVQQPRFYQQLWFRLLAVAAIAGIGAVAGLVLFRRRVKRRLEVLEAEQRLNRERQRIARDLHDEIGSSVTKLGYLIERLESRSADEHVRGLQRRLSSQTRKLALDLDRVVWSIRPTKPTLDALADFIERFVRSFFHATNVVATVRRETAIPSAPISPERQHNLLAVTKEALNNALKHAHPNRITVTLAYADGVFALTVEDDGRGFDLGDPTHSERNGLTNMRTRIGEIGGTITFETAPGHGTQISIKAPLRSNASADDDGTSP